MWRKILSCGFGSIFFLLQLGCQQPQRLETSHAEFRETSRQLATQPDFRYEVSNQILLEDQVPSHIWGQLALNAQGQLVVVSRESKKLWLELSPQGEFSKPLEDVGWDIFYRDSIEVGLAYISGFQEGVLLQGTVSEGETTSFFLSKAVFPDDKRVPIRIDRRWAQDGVARTPLIELQPEGVLRHWVEQLMVGSNDQIYLLGQWDQNKELGLTEAMIVALGETVSRGSAGNISRRTHFLARFNDQGQFQSVHALHYSGILDALVHEDYIYFWLKNVTPQASLSLIRYHPEQDQEIHRATLNFSDLMGSTSTEEISFQRSWIRWVGQREQDGFTAIHYRRAETAGLNLAKINLTTDHVEWSSSLALPELERILDMIYNPDQRIFYLLGLKKEIKQVPGKIFGRLWTSQEEVYQMYVYVYHIIVP